MLNPNASFVILLHVILWFWHPRTEYFLFIVFFVDDRKIYVNVQFMSNCNFNILGSVSFTALNFLDNLFSFNSSAYKYSYVKLSIQTEKKSRNEDHFICIYLVETPLIANIPFWAFSCLIVNSYDLLAGITNRISDSPKKCSFK